MIPNIKTGASFRGAALYYLHDKRTGNETLRLSEERVAWTETRNTAHDHADEAIQEMIATARDQDHLKLEHGMRLSGRECEQPVMTISLAWHPSEKPGKEQMIEAADSYLRHMGWAEHQAIYVAHNDTAHVHVHIILNRVHPETGKVLDDAFSKNRSQEWARDYEREQGRIWCEERIGKDYGRANGGEPNGMPHDHAIDAREAERPYAERETEWQTQDQIERAALAQHHQGEREAFFEGRHAAFREARLQAYREVRADYKPRWVEHFRNSDAAREKAEQEAADLNLQALQCARHGDFAGAWQAIGDRADIRRDTERDIAAERRVLHQEQRADTRTRQDDACAELFDERAEEYLRIKERQKQERAELKQLQAARAEHGPYDEARLDALVLEPPADRLDGAVPERPATPEQLEAEAAEDLAASPPLLDERLTEPETAQHGHGKSDPVADAGEHIAGGIGKVAELLANALSDFINPPSPREQAMAKAVDRAREGREAERQPERERADAEMRMLLHENQRASTDPSDTFFNDIAVRIQREWEERRRERDGHHRGR